MTQSIGYLLKIQVIMLSLIVLFFYSMTVSAALSCFYGGIIGISNTLLQRYYLSISTKWDKLDAAINLCKVYRCMIERWIVTILMFTFGFVILELSPLPLIIGCITTQLTLLFWNQIGL